MAILPQGQGTHDGFRYRSERVDDGLQRRRHRLREAKSYVENVGDTDLQFIGVFRAPRYQEVSLSNWLTHTPPALVAQHLNVDPATIAKWPRNSPGVMPA